MAHFAEIDTNNVVQRVLAVPDDQELRGEAYLRDDLGLGKRWVQTSYSGALGQRYAGPGMRWDDVLGAFLLPQPFPSWSQDSAGEWQPPVLRPAGRDAVWDEADQTWVNSPF